MGNTARMNHDSKQFKSLEIALKELEPFIRNGKHLETGRPFKAMHGLRSREGLANWLLCSVFNAIAGKEQLTFASIAEEIGGDGVLVDTATKETWPTEHVMVRKDDDDKRDIETRVVEAIRRKQDKGDEQYAGGKTLVVFVNAGNSSGWWPNRVAKAVPQPIMFGAIWLVGLQAVENGDFLYNVIEIDAENGVSHIWRVRIAPSFDGWSVKSIQ
jgi:hypothetical protein